MHTSDYLNLWKKMSMLGITKVFGMGSTEIARWIVDFLSPKARWKLLENFIERTGYTIKQIAEKCGVKERSLWTARQRGRMGDDLAFNVFKELAKKDPFNLRIALEKTIRDFIAGKKELEAKFEKLEKELLEKSSLSP